MCRLHFAMTTVYFVRHATPNYDNHDDKTRELSAKGLEDRKLVTKFLMDKHIDVVFSSPYKRAIDTILEFAEISNLEVEIIEDFKERKINDEWIPNFNEFCRKQWNDFHYKLSDGECLKEVQERNIRALEDILEKYNGKNIIVGSHGTALSTIINYYNPTFNYSEFEKIKNIMPWIVKFEFVNNECVQIEKYDFL